MKIRVKYLLHGEFVAEVDEEFLKLSPEEQLEKTQEILEGKKPQEFLKGIINTHIGRDEDSLQVSTEAVEELQIDTKVSFVGIEKEEHWLDGNQDPIVVREDWDAYWENGYESPIIYPSQE